MSNRILTSCPVCGGELHVKELKCDNCSTEYRGDFEICDICRLSRDQIDFIKIFIKNQGNIKGVEKDLGISYPTVKNKLSSIIKVLGFEVEIDNIEEEDTEPERMEILEKLNKGDLSSEEALKLLKDLKK